MALSTYWLCFQDFGNDEKSDKFWMLKKTQSVSEWAFGTYYSMLEFAVALGLLFSNH